VGRLDANLHIFVLEVWCGLEAVFDLPPHAVQLRHLVVRQLQLVLLLQLLRPPAANARQRQTVGKHGSSADGAE